MPASSCGAFSASSYGCAGCPGGHTGRRTLAIAPMTITLACRLISVSSPIQRASIFMKCLLTGGAGVVGSHLSEALLDAGYTVHVLDDLSTGSIDNIRHLKNKPRFEYIIDTVMNERLTAELIDGADVV